MSNNGFWKTLPQSDDPAVLKLPPETLLKLCNYLQGMFVVAQALYSEHGRMGLSDVRAKSRRAAMVLASAAPARGYDATRLLDMQQAASKHIAACADHAEYESERSAELGPDYATSATSRFDYVLMKQPNDPAYQAGLNDLKNLSLALWRECHTAPALNDPVSVAEYATQQNVRSEKLADKLKTKGVSLHKIGGKWHGERAEVENWLDICVSEMKSVKKTTHHPPSPPAATHGVKATRRK